MKEYILNVNWVDLVIVILLIRTGYVGFTEGLSYEIFALIGIIGASVLSIHNYKYFGNFFIENLNLPIEFSNFLGFLLIAIIIILVFKYISVLFCKFVKLEIIPGIERYGGLIFGIARGCLSASLILLCLLFIPNNYLRTSIQVRSLAGMTFVRIVPICYDYSIGLFPRFKEAKKENIVEEILASKPSETKTEPVIKKRKLEDNW